MGLEARLHHPETYQSQLHALLTPAFSFLSPSSPVTCPLPLLQWSPRKMLVASACQALVLWAPDMQLFNQKLAARQQQQQQQQVPFGHQQQQHLPPLLQQQPPAYAPMGAAF